MSARQRIFIAGGTGYIGSRLIPLLLEANHEVVGLTREGSRNKLPAACTAAIGDALNGDSYRQAVDGANVFIQLVGVRHPGPAKSQEFKDIDLRAGLEAVRVAREAKIGHFIYLSVAHPAPVMQAYIDVRVKCEAAIAESGLNATIVRPWYVLGPGHRWPIVLTPLYKIGELLPPTREGATRLGMVTIDEMLGTLAQAVDQVPNGIRVLEPKDIRAIGKGRRPIDPWRDSTPALTSRR